MAGPTRQSQHPPPERHSALPPPASLSLHLLHHLQHRQQGDCQPGSQQSSQVLPLPGRCPTSRPLHSHSPRPPLTCPTRNWPHQTHWSSLRSCLPDWMPTASRIRREIPVRATCATPASESTTRWTPRRGLYWPDVLYPTKCLPNKERETQVDTSATVQCHPRSLKRERVALAGVIFTFSKLGF